MEKAIQIIGRTYGRLTVTEIIKGGKHGRKTRAVCTCICGTVKEVSVHHLKEGTTSSCGCSRKNPFTTKETVVVYTPKQKENIIDKRFGRLVVLEKTDKIYVNGCYLYKCQCDCGNITYAHRVALRNGVKKSCGCLNREKVSLACSKDRSNTVYKGVALHERLNIHTKTGQYKYNATCPVCKRTDWAVNPNNPRKQCLRCCKNRNSSITCEQFLQKLEILLNLKISREYKLVDRYYDGHFMYKGHHILIESNGTYWHGLPHNIENDKYKVQIAELSKYFLITVKNDSADDHELAIKIVLDKLNTLGGISS